MTQTRIDLLGPFRLTSGGAEVVVGGPKQRLILAFLGLARRRPVSVDDLLEILWGEDLPATARNSLHYHVATLRKVLAAGGAAEALVTRDPGYLLDATSDVDEFHTKHAEGLRAASTLDHETAAQCFADALNLWRGPALADLREFDLAADRAVALEEERLTTAEGWAEAELACGRAEALLVPLREMVGENPLRERLWEHLMLALYRTGRQDAALSAYRSVRAALDRELGVDPSSRLQSLHQAILRQDPALSPMSARPARPGPRMVTTTLVRSVVARKAAPTLSGPSGSRVELGDDVVTIGRSADCELSLPDDQASRRHARVVPTDAGYLVEDLDSTNGTFVNGELLDEPRLLEDGDRIEIGHSVVRFGHTYAPA